MNESERESLTELFRQKLAEYQRDPSAAKRKYTKRPTGDELREISERHDATMNPWVKVALGL